MSSVSKIKRSVSDFSDNNRDRQPKEHKKIWANVYVISDLKKLNHPNHGKQQKIDHSSQKSKDLSFVDIKKNDTVDNISKNDLRTEINNLKTKFNQHQHIPLKMKLSTNMLNDQMIQNLAINCQLSDKVYAFYKQHELHKLNNSPISDLMSNTIIKDVDYDEDLPTSIEQISQLQHETLRKNNKQINLAQYKKNTSYTSSFDRFRGNSSTATSKFHEQNQNTFEELQDKYKCLYIGSEHVGTQVDYFLIKNESKLNIEKNLYMVDSHLLHVMKSRKQIKHHELIQDCQQLMNNLKLDVRFIKLRIEFMIEQKYICRNETDWNTYNYLYS